MASNVDEYFEAALKYAKEAGDLIRTKISESKTIVTKSCEIDFVTETDQQVENLLMTKLGNDFPSHKFIGEETVAAGGSCDLTDDPTWIIDPIDGTLNFVHSFPHSCVSIGLFINKEPQAGIIYNPMLEQLFTAKKGKGAYLNGKRISVSNKTELTESLLMMENGTSRDDGRYRVLAENHARLVPQVHGLRALGSAALNMAMVALGGADAYFEFGIHIWDIAAGEIIITEAGGVVIEPTGGPIDRFSRRVLCASSPQLAQKLVDNLVQYYPMPRDD